MTYRILLVKGHGPAEEEKEYRYTTACTVKEQADDMAHMFARDRRTSLPGWDNADIYVEEVGERLNPEPLVMLALSHRREYEEDDE